MDELVQLLEEGSAAVSDQVSSAPKTAMKSQLRKAAQDLWNLAVILRGGAYVVVPSALPVCIQQVQDVLDVSDDGHGEMLSQALEANNVVRVHMLPSQATHKFQAAVLQHAQPFSLEREIPPDYLPPRGPRWPLPPIDWPRWPMPPYPPYPWPRPKPWPPEPWPLPPWWNEVNFGRDPF